MIVGIVIAVSGCFSVYDSYVLVNSTFEVPSDFQKGNVTNYDDPAVLTEMTFDLDGDLVFGVDQYANSAEYQIGLQDALSWNFKVYNKTISGTQVTVFEDPISNEKTYFFIKNGKYYSILEFTFGSNLDPRVERAMNTVVETMN